MATIGLRFWGLTFQSYWFDELFSAWVSNPSNSATTVAKLTLKDVHPPAYQLLMWLSYQIFGYNEWAGRLPSALAGMLTVPVIYFLARELFSSRVGLYAAALAVTNYYLLYYAQEARSYALLSFLCSLSFLYLLRVINTPSKRNLIFYIAATLALLYTHYFAFVLMAAQGLVVCFYIYSTGWSNRPLLMYAAIAAGTLVVATAPLVPIIARKAAINNFWIQQPEPGFLIDYFQRYFHSGVVATVMLILICIAASGLFLKAQSGKVRFGVFALLVWISMGYFLPWLRGLIAQPVLTDRNTIMLVPPLLILAGYGLSLISKLWLQRLIVAGLLCYSLYVLFFNLDYYERIRKNQYREITQAMSAFEPALPVYTFKQNEDKYNVYFIQQQSPLLAEDAIALGAFSDKEQDIIPPLFWVAGGHLYKPKPGFDRQYGLIEVGRFSYEGTAAAMLLNPAATTPLTLEKSDGEPGNSGSVYTSALLPEHDANLQLLVTVDEVGRADFAGVMQVALLAENGDVLQSRTLDSVAVPIILMLDSLQGAVSLKITLMTDEFVPVAWLMPVGSVLQ